jgi:hypothetical protein
MCVLQRDKGQLDVCVKAICLAVSYSFGCSAEVLCEYANWPKLLPKCQCDSLAPCSSSWQGLGSDDPQHHEQKAGQLLLDVACLSFEPLSNNVTDSGTTGVNLSSRARTKVRTSVYSPSTMRQPLMVASREPVKIHSASPTTVITTRTCTRSVQVIRVFLQ